MTEIEIQFTLPYVDFPAISRLKLLAFYILVYQFVKKHKSVAQILIMLVLWGFFSVFSDIPK